MIIIAAITYYVVFFLIGFYAMFGSKNALKIELYVMVPVALIGPLLQPLIWVVAFPILYFKSLRAYSDNQSTPVPRPVNLSIVD